MTALAPSRRRTPWAPVAAAATTAALALCLTACGSPSSPSSSSSGPSAAASTGSSRSSLVARDAAPVNGLAAPAEAPAGAGTDSALTSTTSGESDRTAGESVVGTSEPEPGATTPQIVSTGTIALRAADVTHARTAIQDVVDRYHGQIAQDTTAADDAGRLTRSREVLRIPSARFHEAMTAVDGIDDGDGTADLVSSSARSDDVTTQVIDTAVQLRTQRASIDRIRTLLARAASVRTIVTIESELSRRQATLDSLEQRRAYLADQTSMSTITVTVSRTPEHRTATVAPVHHRHGFAAGLHAGWSGFTAAVSAVATAAGAVLPFAALAVVMGVPLWLVVRRRRRTPAAVDAALE